MITAKICPCHSILFIFPWVGETHGVGRLIALKVREIYSEKGMTLKFFFFFAIMFTNWHAE